MQIHGWSPTLSKMHSGGSCLPLKSNDFCGELWDFLSPCGTLLNWSLDLKGI